jgi:enoyl-CoA hydratase/carnithine racemase
MILGNVYYMFLSSPKANNFTTSLVRKMHEKLDEVEKDPEPCCLVTASSIEKFFSTGLNLK